jgi:hypothetical protein
MEQLQDELAALRRRRDDMARLISDGEARGESLDQLAATAAGRLAGADLALQAEVLGLLDVRVECLTPAARLRCGLPGLSARKC